MCNFFLVRVKIFLSYIFANFLRMTNMKTTLNENENENENKDVDMELSENHETVSNENVEETPTGIGSREDVYHGRKLMTKGKLKRKDIYYNEKKQIYVSAKKRIQGLKNVEKLHGYSQKRSATAREKRQIKKLEQNTSDVDMNDTLSPLPISTTIPVPTEKIKKTRVRKNKKKIDSMENSIVMGFNPQVNASDTYPRDSQNNSNVPTAVGNISNSLFKNFF